MAGLLPYQVIAVRDLVVLAAAIVPFVFTMFVCIAEAIHVHRSASPAAGLLNAAIWLASSLSVFVVVAFAVGMACEIALVWDGAYPVSLPVGVAAGYVIVAFWVGGRRGRRPTETPG